MSHSLPHRQLLKEFMTLGPYLRQEQCAPERYIFDCLAVSRSLVNSGGGGWCWSLVKEGLAFKPSWVCITRKGIGRNVSLMPRL